MLIQKSGRYNGTMTNIYEVLDYINSNEECLLLALIGCNYNYIAVNAFCHMLHEKEGYDRISGIVINIRNDPEEGHYMADESFRFPDYCDIKVIHLSEETKGVIGCKKSNRFFMMLKGLIKGILSSKSALYVITATSNLRLLALTVSMVNRRVYHVFIPSGAFYVKFLYPRFWLIEPLLLLSERLLGIRIIMFNAFINKPNHMYRNYIYEKYYRGATEEEKLTLIGNESNENYVIFVSQGALYPEYQSVVEDVLERERKLGFTVYIKPHNWEKKPLFPDGKEGDTLLPRGYAIESIVAGAKKKPDKLIALDSSSLFSCSAWYNTKCYPLLVATPDNMTRMQKRRRKILLRNIDSGVFPNMLVYDLFKD